MIVRILAAALAASLFSFAAAAQADPQADAGVCRKAKGADAIAACDRAIASLRFSGRELADLHVDRGWAYYSIGRLDRAIADYSEAIKLDPKHAIAFTNRGMAWHDRRDYDRALADTNEAVRLDPKFYFARSMRGVIWHARGDFDNAVADFDEAIRLDPQDYGARMNRCWTRAAFNRDLQLALADCNDALRLDPSQPDALESRGFVFFRLMRLDDAMADLDRALTIDPQLHRALFIRGIIKAGRGDGAGGKADLAAAAAIQKDIADEFARYGVRPRA